MKIILSILMGLWALNAFADTELVLNAGECAQVDGQKYCWFFRPSNYNHPELAPRPCDFRKDCPITMLIPASNLSPNIVTKQGSTPGMFFCRKDGSNFKLVNVVMSGSTKTETTVNEYGANEQKCLADEARLGGTSAPSGVGISEPDYPNPVTGPIIVEPTAGRQTPCPETKQYKTTVHKVNVGRFLKRIF